MAAIVASGGPLNCYCIDSWMRRRGVRWRLFLFLKKKCQAKKSAGMPGAFFQPWPVSGNG